jgi:pimeloyl-ACP methyl ester carboxylesterase
MVPGDIASLSKMADPRRYWDMDFMRANFRTLYGDALDESAEAHATRISPPTRAGYLYQLGAMLGWTSAFFLPLLQQKVLVLMGKNDRIVPVVNGRILQTLIPRARLEIVEGGHLFLVSRASEVVPLIRAFYAEPDADLEKAVA